MMTITRVMVMDLRVTEPATELVTTVVKVVMFQEIVQKKRRVTRMIITIKAQKDMDKELATELVTIAEKAVIFQEIVLKKESQDMTAVIRLAIKRIIMMITESKTVTSAVMKAMCQRIAQRRFNVSSVSKAVTSLMTVRVNNF